MTIQTFTAGQKLTALQMNTLQASDFNFTRNVRTDLTYTFVLADKGKLVESTNSGSATFTIPTNADAAFTIGDRIDVLLASDGSVTIAGASGVTVYAEGDLTTISSKWTKVTLIKRATDSWVVTGGGLTVQTVELDNLSVTTAKLANSAVTSDKIADGAITSAHIADGTVIATDIADGSVTSAKILNGTILNVDVSASAGINLSKLESGTSAQIVLANSSGVPTYTTVSGDINISNTGVVTIQPNSVALGTDTTGNYMSGVTAGTGLTVTHTPGEGSTATVALSGYSFTTSSVAYTLALTDNNNLVESTATSDIDITVPPASSVAFPDGTQIAIFRRGTGRVRILEGSGVTILATPGKYLRAQYSGATLVRRSQNVWFLFGDLSST